MHAALDPAVQSALQGDGTVDITTTGARSGLPRRVEIWFLHVDGRTFLTGTPGRRHWYANLLARDHLVFHLKESVTADLPARATPVRDEATRRWLFTRSHPWVEWYRAQASLADLVAAAPLVELHFEGDAA